MAPFTAGESPLQHYNALLSLHWLQRYSDAFMLFQNDRVLQQVKKYMAAAAAAAGLGAPRGVLRSEGASFGDMNRHISGALCGALLPVWGRERRWVDAVLVHLAFISIIIYTY